MDLAAARNFFWACKAPIISSERNSIEALTQCKQTANEKGMLKNAPKMRQSDDVIYSGPRSGW